MSEQPLDLKRSLHIVRRRWQTVAAAAALGLALGSAYAVIRPPAMASTALVRIASPQSAFASNGAPTLVVIATSDPVLSLALPDVRPAVSEPKLQKELEVKSLTPGIISIRAQAPTAADAEFTANAVARAFVQYITSPQSLSGSTGALLLQPASTATGRALPVAIAILAIIGMLIAVVLAAIGVLAAERRDRRLRQRDEIADSIGVPVLASVPVGHPADAAGWVKLLTEYEPTAVDAWRLRGVLDYLGVIGPAADGTSQAERASLAVVSLRSDAGALALGPQLAVFAAGLGIGTHLILGPQQDPVATATLRTACEGLPAPRHLQVTVRDEDNARDDPSAALTVLITVVDEKEPQFTDRMHTSAAVLGVSAGASTAEDLARVAASAMDRGRRITGILVADPDTTDHTTGRIPQLARTTARQAPARLTGIPTETRQWMTQTRRR
jgi:capsular polysaccharide biosynthesis protein